MRSSILAIAAVSLLTASCGAVRDELGQPDGALGPYLNRTVVAVTREQRADRYLLGLMILAPLTLETSPAGVDMTSAVSAINASYGAVEQLYQSIEEPALDASVPSKFAFETHSYDVQKALFRLTKIIILNLDLDETVKDFAALDLRSLISVAQKARARLPAVRRGAATYRDAVFLFGQSVHDHSCADAAGPCADLQRRLTFPKGRAAGKTSHAWTDQALVTLVSRAESVAASRLKEADQESDVWRFTNTQRIAALYHVVKACAAFEGYQEGTGTPNCSQGQAFQGLRDELATPDSP